MKTRVMCVRIPGRQEFVWGEDERDLVAGLRYASDMMRGETFGTPQDCDLDSYMTAISCGFARMGVFITTRDHKSFMQAMSGRDLLDFEYIH